MSDDFKKLEGIRKRLVTAKEKRAKLAGKLESATEELSEYGYKGEKEAEKALVKFDKELDAGQQKLEKMIAAFKKKYPELVDGDD